LQIALDFETSTTYFMEPSSKIGSLANDRLFQGALTEQVAAVR
jgi:hypothetical protein